jgi:signal peptidase I
MQSASVDRDPPRRGRRRLEAAVGRALAFAWIIVIPALLAGVVFRYLVPRTGHGLMGVVASLGNEHGLYLYVGLFLLFSALVHYWRFRFSVGPDLPDTVAQAAPARSRIVKTLGVGLAIVAVSAATLVVRARVAQPYRVLSSSMLPTLKPDELFIGNRLAVTGASPPRRGDIIAFRSSAVALGPGAVTVPDILVKRVLGLPGDRIEMRGSAPVINGWEVPSCDIGDYAYLLNDASSDTLKAMRGELRLEFIEDRAYLTLAAPAALFPGYVVQPGEVFVLGDNRGNSLDSRAYNAGRGGGVAGDAIEARADWFLAGRRRSGAADLGRLFRPIGELDADLASEDGLDWTAAKAEIKRCLNNRPENTTPPPPGPGGASRTGV